MPGPYNSFVIPLDQLPVPDTGLSALVRLGSYDKLNSVAITNQTQLDAEEVNKMIQAINEAQAWILARL